MSEELIDSYVNRTAIADDTKFMTDQFKVVLDLFDKVGTKKIDIAGSKSIKDVATAAKELKTMLDSLESSKQKFVKTDLEGAKASLLEAKAKKELALASKAEAQARKENAAAALLEAKAVQGLAKAEKDQQEALLKGQQLAERDEKQKIATQKQIDELSNDYLQLSRAYTDAAKKAKNYSLVLGENHPVTVAAVKDAKAMYDVLLRVDQSVGQSQRNVGNYKSAFDGLSMSFTQVARELPSLTISVQQFALAISNNLPMVADEIKKAKDEIAALKAQGKDAPTLFQRIGTSLISWQVGLSVGIAILTAIAGKLATWVSGLFDAEAATRKAKESQRQYNEVMQDAVELRERYNKTLNVDYGTIKRNLENDLAYARARGASEVEILQIEKKIADLRRDTADVDYGALDDKALDGRKKALKEAEQAYEDYADKIGYIIVNGERTWYQMDSNDVSDEKKKELAALKKDFDEKQKLFEHDNAIVEEYHNANRDAQVKALELQKALAEQRAKFFAEPLEKRRDALLKLTEYEDFSLKQRINFVKESANIERDIIRGKYNDEVIAAKGNAIKILELKRKLKFDLANVDDKERENNNTVRASEVNRLQELAALEIYTVKTRIGFIEEAANVEKDIVKDRYKNEVYAAKGNSAILKDLRDKLSQDLLNIETKLSGDRITIKTNEILRQRELDQQYNDDYKEYDADRLRKLEEQEQKRFETSKNYIEENASYLLKSLDKERNAKIAAASGDKERQRIEGEYNNKRKKVELDTNIAIIESSLAVAKAKLETAEKSGAADENQISKLKAAIASLKEQLEKLKGSKIDLNIDEARDKLGRIKDDLAEIINVVNSAFSVVGDAILNNLDRQKNAIQEQIDLIEKKKQADIDAVNALTLSEQDKAAKIAIINARAQAQKEEQERKQRAIDLQRARYEKAKNIVEIVGRTALAVLEGLIKGGPALAAVYGAIGAAQLAVAIAQPLPKFKHGREGGPATLGVVGDGGENEVIYSPDLKHAVVTPDTDTLAYIPKGYGVASSVEQFQNMAFKLSHKELPVMPVQQNGNDALIYAMAGSIGRLERVIMNKQETHFHWSNGELQKAIKNGNDWLRYLNGNI